ncbi:hypothetical protein [Bradyrhizobium sp. SUTN9-2]|uniref:hypothetical protein n=1 Tax=Bradyrhizobium sp. SUTN9-2 TaxID=1167456 RepID=UPI001FCEF045|nr:hypothetical protein [Bradyrhizobium sp. SUTN9-2]
MTEASVDPHNFDAFNVAAGQRVQVSQEHQPDRSGQEDFEQQLNETREADKAIADSGPRRSSSTNVSSDTQQPPAEPMSGLARSNPLPSEVIINDEHNTAELRAAKRPRALNNPQGVVIEQQLTANSGGGGAMPAASAVQPAHTGIVVRGHQLDKRPVYSDDAPEILRLEEALIKGGMVASGAKQHAGALLSFSRWLFAKGRPSIVARLDSMSLSNSGDVYEFVGKGNPRNLLVALDRLRTFRSTGEVNVRPRSGRAKLNPPAPNVAPIRPEGAVLMEPGLDNALAQHRACSAPQPAQTPGIVRGHDMRPLCSEDAPVVLGLEETLIKAGTRRLDIAAAQLSASSALRPAQSRGVVTGADMRPLYFDDARDISGLQEAFIKAGMAINYAYQYTSRLRSFSRWLFAKSKPSLVARLDNESLSGDVSEFLGKGDPDGLLRAIDKLRTFRSTGMPKGNSRPPNVAPIQQGHVAINPEQLHQWELRQVLDHLDHQPIPSSVSVPSEELQRLEKDLQDELDRHPAASFSADPEGFSFDLEQFSPEELQRLLDDQSIPSPISVPSEERQRLEKDLQHELDRHPAEPFPSDPEEFSFDLEHFSPEQLRRLLDDQSIPSPISVPSAELQRQGKDLQDELHQHPALSFSADPEEFSFDLEQFSPGELRRLLDDQSILSPLSAPSEELQGLEKDAQDGAGGSTK